MVVPKVELSLKQILQKMRVQIFLTVGAKLDITKFI